MNFISKSRLSSNLGQGLIEYILVIFVTVVIVLGLAQRMYKPLGDFIEAFMGTYVACLLETGELPQLGADGGSGECRPPLMGEGPVLEVEGAPPGSGTQTGGNRSLTDDSDKVTSNPASGAGGPGASVMGRGGRGGNGRRFTVGSNGTAGGDGANRRTRRIEVALEGGGAGSFYNSRLGGGGSGSIYRQGSKYVAITGGVGVEIKERQERQASRVVKQRVDNAGEVAGDGLNSKRIAVQPPPPRNVANVDDDIKTLDISTIVKYILIAGIIIILIALIGGQALQLSKSWEKAE